MSYERLLKIGAQVVAGEVFLKHVLMGAFTKDGFVMSAEGEAALAPSKKDKPKADAAPEGTDK